MTINNNSFLHYLFAHHILDRFNTAVVKSFFLMLAIALLSNIAQAELASSTNNDTQKTTLESTKKNTEQVVLINRGTDREPVFDVQNNSYGPIEFELSADEFVNMQSEPALPLRKIVPARTTTHLARFTQAQAAQPWSYTYTTRYVTGDPKARHLTGKPYRLPFGALQAHTVTQDFNGEFSHQHPKTKYAIDISMPEKTKVHSARTGIVIEIVTEKLGDTTAKKGFPVHLVRILHHDGTMAVYAYLKPGSLSVRIGQRVQRGQLIGLSGTSFNENVKPHLHFAIQKNTGMQLESIPFKFLGANKTAIVPKSGMELRHPVY